MSEIWSPWNKPFAGLACRIDWICRSASCSAVLVLQQLTSAIVGISNVDRSIWIVDTPRSNQRQSCGLYHDWRLRFWRNTSEWVRDPKLVRSRGRLLPEGPPLLEEQRDLRQDAEQLWNSLRAQGWNLLNNPPGVRLPRSKYKQYP